GRRVTAFIARIARSQPCGLAAGHLIAASCMIVLLTASAAAAAGDIKSVVVEGNNRISVDTIRTHLLLSPGQSYDAARADQSVRALFATGQFADVRIEQTGSQVVVKVVENPIVGNITLQGNSELSTEKLEPALQMKKGAPYTR